MSLYDVLKKKTNQKCFIPAETFWMTPGLCKPMSVLLQVFWLTVELIVWSFIAVTVKNSAKQPIGQGRVKCQ